MSKGKTRTIKAAAVKAGKKTKAGKTHTVGHPKVTKARGRVVVARGRFKAETTATDGATEKR